MHAALNEIPIEYVKGIGSERAKLLRTELGLETMQDLLEFYPFRYIDRTRIYRVSEIKDNVGFVQMRGTISDVKEAGGPRQKRLTARFHDETGSIELVWFQGIQWVMPMLKPGVTFLLFGKPNYFHHQVSIAHPELEVFPEGKQLDKGLQAIYHSTEKLTAKGLNSRGIEKIFRNFIPTVYQHIEESVTEEILQEAKLIPLQQAYYFIHMSPGQKEVFHARRRLKFEELFFLQLGYAAQKVATRSRTQGFVFGKVGDRFNTFYNSHLPFPLTNAQKRVVKEIRQDCMSGRQMSRLLQGDVGSGKTVVALLAILLAIDNGFQACLMAPTEILATQHYHLINSFFTDIGLQVALLTGSVKASERKKIHQGLEDGTINLLVGTHALLENKVQYQNLGLAIIDEQHRFGVAQRARLWAKNQLPPHILVMTATPIPRTLAMTIYGDLDVSVIDELPVGRKPIQTLHRDDSQRAVVFKFIEDEVRKGRQVYVVYPLIEESEALDYKDLMDGFESISRRFPLPEYRVSIVHGRMKSGDKEFEMQRFIKGETQIMVATTVIEVGVNVPNASVMVIESAERFGLSQLHQLRGRVGRGAEQSYCILMTGGKLSQEARERIHVMCETNDGFKIAEVDLKLRGPGDILGTQQSGLVNLKISDLTEDGPTLEYARKLALRIVEEDPRLQLPKNQRLLKKMNSLSPAKTPWSKIL